MTKICEIEVEIHEDIAGCSASGHELLHIAPGTSPLQIVTEINDYLSKLKADECRLEEDDILALAALLGDQYVAEFGWHWAKVIPHADEAGTLYGVLSPDNAILIAPFWWVNHVLSTAAPANLLLNFRLVSSGKLPEAQAGAAVGFH